MSLREKARALTRFLRNQDIHQIAKEDLTSMLAATMTNDPVSTVVAIKKTITDVAYLPTYMFWDKMECFLYGTFHNYEDQIKMANRFDPETDDYEHFVVKQVSLIDKIEDREKIPFFASLTRAFLLEQIGSSAMYFKLAQFITQCTFDELLFLQNCDYAYADANSAMISALYQYGLFEQGETVNEITRYRLSDFAKALKMNSLNFYNGLQGIQRISDYSDMKPLSLPKPMTWGDFTAMDGGSHMYDGTVIDD